MYENDQNKSIEQPVRIVLDNINKDSEVCSELLSRLKERLASVLRQQPKAEEVASSTEPISGSSDMFNDLDNHWSKIKRHNRFLLELIEDLEL